MFENHYKCRCGSHALIPAMKKGSSRIEYRTCLSCGTQYRPESQFDKKKNRASIKDAERGKQFWIDSFNEGRTTEEQLRERHAALDSIIEICNRPRKDPREFPAVKAGIQVIGDADREQANMKRPPEYALWDLLHEEIDIESLQVLIAKAKAWDQVSHLDDVHIEMARVYAEMPLTHCEGYLSEIKANAEARAATMRAYDAIREEE